MLKKTFIISLFPLVITAQQTGKVGVNDESPQEVLDVNGTLRVRDLPADKATNAIYNGAATKATTFNSTNVVLADTNGTFGKAVNRDLVPNKNVTGFTTDDNSTAMFVIKRFTVGDWPSGEDNGKGFNTGMSITKWEPIMSNVQYRVRANNSVGSLDIDNHNNPNDAQFPFTYRQNLDKLDRKVLALKKIFNGTDENTLPLQNQDFGWRLKAHTDTWRVVGDINSVDEGSTVDCYVDILFINKNYVAADSRTN